MFKMDENDPERFIRKQEIIRKYSEIVYKMSELEQEREEAYHAQKGDTKPDRAHMRKLIDIQHPENPWGARQEPGFDPKHIPEYGPGGRRESQKVILLPNA